MTPDDPALISPAAPLRDLTAYAVPRAGAPIDLRLDGNEGQAPPAALLTAATAVSPEVLRRYPDPKPLEARLAGRLGIEAERVIVTAGGDDALDRACRAVLEPGRNVVFPVPGFAMLPRYARLAGAEVVTVPWPEGRYPTDAVLSACNEQTAMVVVTSPNNPTGGVTTAEDLRRLAAARPTTLIVVDLAYAEFADEDLTATALALPNTLVVRTLSKAWGLAGLRVGYAAGSARTIGWLRAAGAPYPVSSLSLCLAEARLNEPDLEVDRFVTRVRRERVDLSVQLTALGARPLPSEANFVAAHVADPIWLRDALAGLGIGIRAFPEDPSLDRLVRISCPGDTPTFRRLSGALQAALAPEALLFDMDGVLVDDSRSFVAAIIQTAADFGVTVVEADVAAAKAAGDANNDWVVTQRLLAARGVEASLGAVTETFEALYQGTEQAPGLRRFETPLVDRDTLAILAKSRPLGVVTGRPRADAERWLNEAGLTDLFATVVCVGDAAAKPDPAPVRLALAQLGVASAWLVGDTVDDIRAARAAGVVPLGFNGPPDVLTNAGAARVLTSLSQLLELLS